MALLGFAVTNEVRDKSLSDSLETMLEGYDENSNLGRLRYLGSFMLLLYPLGSNVVRTAWFPVYYRPELRFLFVQLPATDGAEKLYTYQLHPLFLGHTILGAVSDEVVKTIATRQPEIQ
ncbi:HVA22-like protein k, partial [Cucurbita argyrosperma subsp. argyrosperma]